MPKITISGYGTFETEAGQRLVNAVEAHGVDIGHRCGGYAGCTTCRIEFIEGEPKIITRAEYDKLSNAKLLGKVRLACQILVENDMTFKPLMTVKEMGWPDPGPSAEETITPIPDWIEYSPDEE